jgi:ABC-type uncharacterized transport system involved in gliding motility auxiliary subunit
VNTEWAKTRQTKYAAYAATYIIIILAVLVVANFLANRYNKSFDATANKRYSLSDQTKKIARDLKQDVTIQYFDKPSGMQAGKDLLDRYAMLSSKIHIEYVDYLKKPQLARAANISREGEAVVSNGVKTEEAKTFDEEGITGAMIRMLKGGARTVCVVSGSGEHRVEDSAAEGLSEFQTSVQKDNYKVKSEIGDNDALLTLLASWGVTLDKNLILDENPVNQLVGVGPETPLVTSYESHPIVNDLAGTATGFPISRSLETKNGDKTTVTKLFSTSKNSFATTTLNAPEIRIDPNKDKQGPFTLAAAGTYSTGKENSQGRFVVVGNSRWAANNFIRFNGNRNLLLNMLNWLSSDEDLISIRPKEPEDRRINLTRAQFLMLRSVAQFMLPLIVIIGGVMVWWKRR